MPVPAPESAGDAGSRGTPGKSWAGSAIPVPSQAVEAKVSAVSSERPRGSGPSNARPERPRRSWRKRLKRFYRPLVALLLRALAAGARAAPRRLALELGDCLGRAAYALMKGARSQAAGNLALVFGERPRRERARIARDCFRYFGRSLVETLRLPAMTAGDLAACVRADSFAPVERVLARGKGLIVLSAHMGAWEVLAAYLAARLGRPFHAMGARIYYGPYNDLLVGIRRACGVETVYRDDGVRTSLRVLRDGRALGILADQDNSSSGGVFVEFLGRPTWTPLGPAALARSSGAGMVPIVIAWERHSHRVHVLPEVELVKSEDRRADLVENTRRWVRAIEAAIRRHPAQWAWFHRSWRGSVEAPARRVIRGNEGGNPEGRSELA